jgi:phosphoribosylaminoimidazolecarboxamide formyltransferase/IMP cyclohydrolase
MNAAAKRALVSVSDKTGLAELVAGLVDLGFEIVSTGGTRRFLEERGVRVIDVSSYTGFPEIMEGRVKTLHPRVHGAILGRPDLADDAAAIREHGIVPFQIVVCNLYPFEQTVASPRVTFDDAVEQIDVGGPSMVRAAAKNHAYVAVVTDPAQYASLLERLRRGDLPPEFRRELALAAFQRTAAYDRAIALYLERQVAPEAAVAAGEKMLFPERLTLELLRHSTLRYGENPHQRGAWYVEPAAHAATLARAQVLHGKELSYNNLLDLDSALAIVREFAEPAAVIIKHNNPCGAGLGSTLAGAFKRAYAGDPVSAFGSIVGLNRTLDDETAELLCLPDRFVEAVIAPGYEPSAFQTLSTRPKWARNVRLLACPAMAEPRPPAREYRSISGGMLVQDRDEVDPGEADGSTWRTVTLRQPSEAERADLRFAWLIAKHVKSNAIVFARERTLVGVGAGQMSRLDSVRLASVKADDRGRDAVLASDAFFPFRDGIDAAAMSGITAIAQPGGSRRDEEVIAACDERGLAMVFTGRRHFWH